MTDTSHRMRKTIVDVIREILASYTESVRYEKFFFYVLNSQVK